MDDEPTNRLVLSALLGRMGYTVVEAENGFQAIERFSAESPDIVFMDLMMPGMDGYEATARIKALSGDHFVPVIVLTAVSDEQAQAKCIEVGGDDVLTKPFQAAQLKSKIHAMVRIRDLYRKVTTLLNHMRRDEEIAEQVFSRAVTSKNVEPGPARTLLRPASVFSGDMVLTAYGPGGDLHMLLGDFTGHGLAAAIGALPTAEVFHAMIDKGFGGRDILAGINEKLCTLLPSDMFMAACYVHIPRKLSHAIIFNCGLPPALIVDEASGRIKHRIRAHHFALGIDRSFPTVDEFEWLTLNRGDRLVLYTDGLIEGRNPQGEEFGRTRLEQAIESKGAACAFDQIVSSMEAFCQNAPQHDDITMVEIPFVPGVLADRSQQIGTTQERVLPKLNEVGADSFKISLTLQGARLGRTEAVPIIMNELQEIQVPREILSEVYTVLSELYSNALDYGVLRLDSSLMEGEDGVRVYFDERKRRLNALQEGYVSIDIQAYWQAAGGSLVIRVEDSGPGFPFNSHVDAVRDDADQRDEGIPLVRKLCQSVSFKEPGNKVEAVYTWVV